MNTLTFKTGVSDHHKLVGTMPRPTFTKGIPIKIFYGCYKKFEEELKKQYCLHYKNKSNKNMS